VIQKYHIVFVILFVPPALKAQKKTEHTNMFWAGYYNTIRFNKSWSVQSDAQLRTKDWMEKWSQFLIRTGLSYSFNDRIAVTGGFAFFKNAQYAGKQLLLKNEWRPWQEFSYQLSFNKINFIQRLRTEQRFLQQVENGNLSDHYEYIFRLRYKFEWQFSLPGSKLKLMIGNEVLVNPGYINNTRFFDQNRTFAGINFKMSPVTVLQFQYLKIFQWDSRANVLNDQNVFRLNINQQFSLQKNHYGK